MKERTFQRGDWLVGIIAALVSFAVYAWTTAPSVTLLDSGEFALAAQHFGVPHPTGYPLWTLLAWLFQLVPLGNAAWQIALFSGVCGALAVGLCAMLIRSTATWIFPGAAAQPFASVAAVAFGLVFAFSQSMWSQAVIIEVYTLHALLVGLYLTGLYLWLRRPERLAPFYWGVFWFTLAFSNHQLTLALAPLPFLIVALVRRDLFWDLLLATAVTVLIAYLAFALIADNPLVVRAAIRLTFLVGTILIVALILKRGRLQWQLTAFLPVLIAAGLLPYAYLPIASSTNPPMNWGYTRTAEGFYYSFNRSQYPGSLSHLSLRVLGRVLGVGGGDETAIKPPAGAQDRSPSTLGAVRKWTAFFWAQIIRSFSPLGVLFFFAAVLAALRLPLAGRTWLYVLLAAFALAMALQPILERATTDQSGWWLQMPYHTYTNFIFALLAGIGACAALRWLGARFSAARFAAWSLLLLPLGPLWRNADSCSQRGRYFGWQFGRDMLANLPKGSVVFGGTDAGRFVPTYLILGESSLPPSRRIDPGFDRSDLYILTQNGLGDRFYLAYIRDHYGKDRPAATGAFARWLGRDRAYPKDPLILPTLEEMREIGQKEAKTLSEQGRRPEVKELTQIMHNAVARWIFEKNRDRHAFYVEESFPMKWSYPHAVPEGLLYRINPTPLDRLPDDVVARDLKFWAGYLAVLKSDPNFMRDLDARRSFSHLRETGANIYEFRGLAGPAEVAYREALDLWIGNLNALTGLAKILWRRQAFDEVIGLFERARLEDPNSRSLLDNLLWAIERKRDHAEIVAALAEWRKAPTNLDPLGRAIERYSKVEDEDAIDALLREAIAANGNTPEFLFFVSQVSQARRDWPSAADAAERWMQVEPDSAEAAYRFARAKFALGQKDAALPALARAVERGGTEYRERLFRDELFAPLKGTPELQKLLLAPPAPGGTR